jgi:hypothetical protein
MGELRRELSALLAGVFAQARSRLAAFASVGALLAEPGDRRSCWQLAEQAWHAVITAPRPLRSAIAASIYDQIQHEVARRSPRVRRFHRAAGAARSRLT